MTTADAAQSPALPEGTTRPKPRKRAESAIAARGVVTDLAGMILIVAPPLPRKFWYLPGGKTRYGERPSVACYREIKEELGISVAVGAHLITAWNPDPVYALRDWNAHVFECGVHDSAALNEQIRPRKGEVERWRWVEPDEALELLHPGLAIALKAARAGSHFIEYDLRCPRPL